jgi:hypothetical protein
MPNYVASSDNRFYAALEPEYGAVAAITGANNFPAVALGIQQTKEKSTRKDKTGGRTFPGLPAGMRRHTSFDLRTYMTGWTDTSEAPGYGPLFEAAMGEPGRKWAGGTVQSQTGGNRITFSAAHGLRAGQAVTFGGEIRFVAAVVDDHTVQLAAPFTLAPTPGSHMGATMTYSPGDSLPSVSVFDYWSPSTAVQRIVRGGAVSRMKIKVNDDFHEFEFSGPAADVMDSVSFESGEGGMVQFPEEPPREESNYAVIPGHLGQAWIGTTPTLFQTVTGADFELDNDVELRDREFGSSTPRAVVPGRRSMKLDLSLFQQDDAATQELYQAARQGSPVPVMFQLGQRQGQLFGIYMKAVAPEVPEFDDQERRLEWKFSGCRAQGSGNDEVFIAFG